MICPNCKCQYIRGVTECAECGVALVDQLEEPAESPSQDVRIVAIWQGKDSAECERVQQALESADIPFTSPDSKSQFSFLPTEASLEIWISEADQERARKILLGVEGPEDAGELTPEEIEPLTLPEPDDSIDDQPNEAEDLSKEWHEDDPGAEVWNGDNEAFADYLITCLREIGINSRRITEAGRWRLEVRPEQKDRAKEIVREVVDASPPE